MKSKIENNIVSKPYKYPCIGVSEKYDGLTVLFTSEGKGICLIAGNTPHEIGYTSDSWAYEVFKMQDIITITFES